MTHKQALKMRAAIHALFSFSSDGRYEVAIQKRFTGTDQDDWEVHLFIREQKRSGLMDCALLSHAIEQISTDLLAVESEYDMSTSGEPVRVPSFKIW